MILTVLVFYWGRFHYFDGRVGRRSVHHKNFRFNVDPGIAPEMIFHEIFIFHGIYKIQEQLFKVQIKTTIVRQYENGNIKLILLRIRGLSYRHYLEVWKSEGKKTICLCLLTIDDVCNDKFRASYM